MENKHVARLILCFAIFASNTSVAADSFSELDFGFDRINYEEHLSDVGHLGDAGRLQQSASVLNPTIRNLSFSELEEKWGLIVRGSSTLATSLEQERWSVGRYGTVQEDEFKLKYADIGAAITYELKPKLQLLVGGNFTSSGFTRSNFARIEPGATQFETAIKPSTLVVFSGAINEDQYAFLATVGLRYDTRFESAHSKLTYYGEINGGVPLYSLIQNTTIPNESLTASFNGWGISGSAGIRYQLTRKLSAKFGINAQYAERNEIISYKDNSRMRVPDIQITTLGAGFGIAWIY
jgi:hypothetical protein